MTNVLYFGAAFCVIMAAFAVLAFIADQLEDWT